MRAALIAIALGLVATPASASASPRVFSLDQCADQYVLALSPRDRIVGLSERARNFDSALKAQAAGLPLRRATTESVLAAHPDVVVRDWGGDDWLARSLRRWRIGVVQIDEARDFAGVRTNIRKVAAALDRRAAGEVLIARMNAQLSRAAAGPAGAALYVTPGGDTAGSGTLVDAALRAANVRNLARAPGYSSLSLEQLVAHPPPAMVLGFFKDLSHGTQHWTLAGNARFRSIAASRATASLPGALIGCPVWFAADAAILVAAGRRPS